MGRTLAPLLLGPGGGVVGADLGLLLAGGELFVFLFLVLFLDLVVAAGALPELPDAAAEAPSQLGDALRPEEQEDDDQRDDQLRSPERTDTHKVLLESYLLDVTPHYTTSVPGADQATNFRSSRRLREGPRSALLPPGPPRPRARDRGTRCSTLWPGRARRPGRRPVPPAGTRPRCRARSPRPPRRRRRLFCRGPSSAPPPA